MNPYLFGGRWLITVPERQERRKRIMEDMNRVKEIMRLIRAEIPEYYGVTNDPKRN